MVLVFLNTVEPSPMQSPAAHFFFLRLMPSPHLSSNVCGSGGPTTTTQYGGISMDLVAILLSPNDAWCVQFRGFPPVFFCAGEQFFVAFGTPHAHAIGQVPVPCCPGGCHGHQNQWKTQSTNKTQLLASNYCTNQSLL